MHPSAQLQGCALGASRALARTVGLVEARREAEQTMPSLSRVVASIIEELCGMWERGSNVVKVGRNHASENEPIPTS